MFENLVESGSHKQDVTRKGSFILVTFGIYAVLLSAAFIAGIWWASANIDAQTLELTALIAPVPVQQQQKQEAKPEKVEITKNVDVRKELIADVSRADLVPKEVSAKASDIPPVRKGVVTMVGSGNSNAIAPVAPGNGTGQIISAPTRVEIKDEPPPAPPPKPTPHAPISGGVLNGKAVHLVQPPYPTIARSAHACGAVNVQITIDENGNVLSARPVSGHPLLQAAAGAAARGSKFTPTKLSGQPVKVSGIIVYNFTCQ